MVAPSRQASQGGSGLAICQAPLNGSPELAGFSVEQMIEMLKAGVKHCST
jgi:hypothetical protein